MLNDQNFIWPFLLMLFLLQPFGDLMSQEDGESFLVDCKLWTKEGDTIVGKLLYINQYNLQFNVALTNQNKSPFQYFSPKDISGFVYTSDNEQIEFNSVVNPVDLGRVFLRVLYRGKYTLYQFLEINKKSTVLSFQVSYYLWQNEWLKPPITYLNEKESLLYHFADCPELEYKIKSGTYRLSQIKTIIEEYERCNLTDTYEFFYE
jgi:hypothetical protein